MHVSSTQALERLFTTMVRRRLFDDAQICDLAISGYVAALLAEFVHVKNLYRVRNSQGRRLEDVGEMMIASNPLGEGRSFDHERAVRKHIGDYTLFYAGLFPEHVAALPRYNLRLDAFVDYVKAGKESYRIVSFFDQFEYRNEAPLFRKLSESFELCVYGLNLVKQDLDQMRQPNYLEFRELM